MIIQKFKNGIVFETTDTCATLDEAKMEKISELVTHKKTVLEDLFIEAGYTYTCLDCAKNGLAVTTAQAYYDDLETRLTNRLNILVGAVNECTSNAQVYAINWFIDTNG